MNFYTQKKLTQFVLFLLLLLPVGLLGQSAKLDSAQKYIESEIASGSLTGIYVGYIQPGGEVSELALGTLGRTNKSEVSAETIFEIGSLSKTFTATLLAKMIQDSKFTLETPIQQFLPDSVEVPTFKEQQITLGHLVTHTSGLPRMPSNFSPKNPLNPYQDYTTKQMYHFLDGYTLSRAPGSQVAYSNLGAGLLGHILELHYGKPYEELVKEYIAEPLNMESTGIAIQQADSSRLAYPFNYGAEVAYWDFPTLTGAGGLRSTGNDMIKYMKAQMGLTDTQLKEPIALTHTIQMDSGEGLTDDIGLSWFFSTQHDTLIWHNGGTGGFKSFAGYNKEDQTGVVVLANGTSDVPDRVGFYLLDKRHELPKIKKAVNVSQDQLEKYTGSYQITPMFGITVTQKEGQLFAQATGQQKFPVFPESQTMFYFKVVEAKLEFIENENGAFNKVILHQGGREMIGEKSDS